MYRIGSSQDIHRLDGCLGLNDIVNILEKNNIAYRKYETTDYDYYKKVIEIDVLDILLHYGIVGFAVYFAPF